MDINAEDQRGTKRVRQACENCRRKKTRCSGERPICSFCARLKQTCRYNTSYVPEHDNSSYENSLQQVNSGLAARVALLESRLSLLDANGSNDATLSNLFNPHVPTTSPTALASHTYQDSASQGFDSFALLDTDTLQSLVDVYFQCCHNQPYSFFHEATFRQDLHDSNLPSYILWALIATAARFSEHPSFADHLAESTDCYAKLAWSEVIKEAFSDTNNIDIRIVQATSMLGVIDYISGRDRLAWMKFGLAIRFAQTLQLGKEPGFSLPSHEAEERRHTFWSVYILDRLASCGRNRPPALLDTDCTSRLPLSQRRLQLNPKPDSPTLAALHEIPDKPALESDDYFALTIFMVSAFGLVVRWAFQHGAATAFLPWDSRSELARINGILTSFETYSDACDGDFADVLDRDFASEGVLDERAACHFSYAHVLYHVNQCLLHHPFLLGQHLKSRKIKIAKNFFRDAIRKSLQHAEYLTTILRALQERNFSNHPSFFGYAAALAGSIHRLHARDPHCIHVLVAEANWQTCVNFLDQTPVVWESYRRMSGVLKDFDPSPSLASSLLSCATDPTPFEGTTEEELWHMCDYSWLTNSARRPSMSTSTPRPDMNQQAISTKAQDAMHSPDFETLLEGALSFDFGLLDQVTSQTALGGAFSG